MNRIIGLKTIIFVVVIFLCSCVPSQSPPHPEGIPNGNLNQVVKIIAPQEWNTFKLGNSIDLEITNLSNRSLVFDKGFGVRIFLAKNNQWVEIKDKLKSIGADSIFMRPTTSNKSETRGFSVSPDVDELAGKTLIRIYIFGKTLETNEVIGAYVDVVLSP